jgi:hypothetical protein
MTDDQVEQFILQKMRKKGVTFYDMIGLPNHGVDPNPEDTTTPRYEKGIRSNRFETCMGSDRMRELLCKGKYSPYNDTIALKVPFQDLFRFWWNRCVVQEYVVDEVLEDIYEYLTELLRPPEEKKTEEEMDVELDFEQVPLFAPAVRRAA